MPEPLLRSMEHLVHDLGMLCGLSVSYGTADKSHSEMVGLAREVRQCAGGYGDDPQPLQQSSLYDLASLTKLFTAVSLMQLIQAGQLRMADRIGWLDDRFAGLKDTTLLEAMSYQAVLRTPQRVDAQPGIVSALDQVFQTRRQVGPEPAKLYSDMNALVLGHVLERVAGMRYLDYLQQQVFGPCGMQETYARVPAERLPDCVDYSFEHRVMQGSYLVSEGIPPGQPHDPKARVLGSDGGLCGHAGLFSTAGDMVRFAQGLLSEKLLQETSLMQLGQNRTGRMGPPYRQYLGLLVFAKSPVQKLSEVPGWMGDRAFGISGYTGNHIAVDPQLGVFDVFLGNRCHNRVSIVEPEEDAAALGLDAQGVGRIQWTDERRVRSSVHYYRQKDRLLHAPVRKEMIMKGWLPA